VKPRSKQGRKREDKGKKKGRKLVLGTPSSMDYLACPQDIMNSDIYRMKMLAPLLP
jgi:hypothetical protein